MDILTIRNLKKSFGDKHVLCGVDLSVPKGSVFGFVGKNGAGKTTAMKTVLGLIRADSGEITVSGERVIYGQTETNRHIGYLPDVPEFYSFMTAGEYLRLCGECLELDRVEISKRTKSLLDLVGLGSEKHRIKGFSRGMKQRLGVASALIGKPDLLICDEPTSALDPIGRKDILDILLSVRNETTVLFSTHILSDVERICSDVALLDGGRIAFGGKVSDVKNKYSTDSIEVEVLSDVAADDLLKAFPNARKRDGNTLVFWGNDSQIYDIMECVSVKRIPVCRIERAEPSLESLLMRWYKNEIV